MTEEPPPRPTGQSETDEYPMQGRGAAFVIAVILLFVGLAVSHHLPFKLGDSGKAPTTSSSHHSSPSLGTPYKVKVPTGTCQKGASCQPAKQYAYNVLAAKGETGDFSCLINLWNGESGWDPWAYNSNGGAYGIPQALGHGHVYDMGDWKAQVDWGLAYIQSTYGTPCAAWAFWQRTDPRPFPGHWY